MITLIILVFLALPLITLICGAIIGTVKYLRDNRPLAPPKAYTSDFATLDALEDVERKKARERDYLTALIANLEDLQRIIESKEHDEKQLRQLITIDKQIHAAQAKLEKLG